MKTNVKSNEFVKKDFNIKRDGIIHEKQQQQKRCNKIVETRSFELPNLKEKINRNSLVYRYKTEGIIPNYFSNYQNSIDSVINYQFRLSIINC